LPQPPITPHTLSCSLSSSIVLIACLLPYLACVLACVLACLPPPPSPSVTGPITSHHHNIPSRASSHLNSNPRHCAARHLALRSITTSAVCTHTHTRRRHPPAVTSAPSLHSSRDSPSSSLYARAKPPLMLAALCTD